MKQQQQQQQATVRRERRPDRAVYIPRARRSQTTPPAAASGTSATITTITADNMNDVNLLASTRPNAPINVEKVLLQKSTKNSYGNRHDVKTTTTTEKTKSQISSQQKKIYTQMLNELTFEQEELLNKKNEKIQLNEVREESGKEKEKEFLNLFNSAVQNNEIQPTNNDCDNTNSVQQQQQQLQVEEGEVEEKRQTNDLFIVELETIECNIVTKRTADVDENLMHMEEEEEKEEKLLTSGDNNNINNNMSLNKKSHEIEENIEEQELKRASKEMNRSNRRIIKQTFVSDVLEIPDQLSNTQNNLINDHIETRELEPQQKKETNEATTDEDDWDAMYDESGACLDTKITQEITNAVGKVKLDLPEMDYSVSFT